MGKSKKKSDKGIDKRSKRSATRPKALQFIVKVVKGYTSIQDVDFDEPTKDKELCNYELKITKGQPINAAAIHNNNRTVPVVPLKSGVLLYISITYSSPSYGSFEFSNISMQFFDSKKKLIFRAELGDDEDIEGTDKDVIIRHPQPHWHLDTIGLLNKNKVEDNSFIEHIDKNNSFLENYQNKTTQKTIDFSRLHLFMDYNNPITERKWQENDVVNWVKKSLESICNELDFVSK